MIKKSKIKIFSFFLFFNLFVLLNGSHVDFREDELDEFPMSSAATPIEALVAESTFTAPPDHVSLQFPENSSNFEGLEEEVIMRACPICIESLDIESSAIVTKCGHLFHQSCLNDWFLRKYECPKCRLGLWPMSDYSKRLDFESFVNDHSIESLAKKDTKDLIDLLIYAEVNDFTDSISKILDALLLQGKISFENDEIGYSIMQLMAIAVKKDKLQNYNAIWNIIETECFENDLTKLINGKSNLIQNKVFEKFIPSLVKFAIYIGADVNNTDQETGKTAVQLTANNEQLELFKIILDSGRADITKIDSEEMTILHSAIDSENFEIAKTILGLESPFYKSQIQCIINHLDDQGRCPLYLAMIRDNPEIFKLLLVDHYADLDQNLENGLTVLETIIEVCENDEIFDIFLDFIDCDLLKFDSAVNFARDHPEYKNSRKILAKENDSIAENEKIFEIIERSKENTSEVEAEFDLETDLRDEKNWQNIPELWAKIVANNQIEEAFDIAKDFEYNKKLIFLSAPNFDKEFTLHMLRSDRKNDFLNVYFDPYIDNTFFPMADAISSIALCEGIEERRINEYLNNPKYGPLCYWKAMIAFTDYNMRELMTIKAKWEKNKSKLINEENGNIIEKCNLLIKFIDYITSNDEDLRKEILEKIEILSASELPYIIFLLVKNNQNDLARKILESFDESKIMSSFFSNYDNFDLKVKLAHFLPENLKTCLVGYGINFEMITRNLKFVGLEIFSEANSTISKVCYKFLANIDGTDETIQICKKHFYYELNIIDEIITFNFLSSDVLLDYIKLTMTLVPNYNIKAYYEKHTYGPGIVQLIANSEEVTYLLKSMDICLPVNNEAIAELKLEQNTTHFQDLHKILKPKELNLTFSKDLNYLENLEIITGKDIVTLFNESDIIREIEIDPYEYKKYRHIFNYMMIKSLQSIHKINSKLLRKIISLDFANNPVYAFNSKIIFALIDANKYGYRFSKNTSDEEDDDYIDDELPELIPIDTPV